MFPGPSHVVEVRNRIEGVAIAGDSTCRSFSKYQSIYSHGGALGYFGQFVVVGGQFGRSECASPSVLNVRVAVYWKALLSSYSLLCAN